MKADTMNHAAGLIWITGYSSAGKSTVGRKTVALLKQRGVQTIFMDGDDLRSVFSAKWGYERADRVQLALVYFRLSSYLASQGYTVIISAVAMYDEVREWMRANIPNAMEVFLDVPEEERIRRDRETKKIYGQITKASTSYDEPRNPDLRLSNFGATSPDQTASAIAEGYISRRKPALVDKAHKSEHWNRYYSAAKSAPDEPSPFARCVAAEKLVAPQRVLEIGCGNGRDAVYLAGRGHDVVAIDTSGAAIDLCRSVHGDSGVQFVHATAADWVETKTDHFDAVYSRFVLHAMTEPEEVATCRAAYDMLKPGGRLLVECRSINDPMARLGDIISPTERIHGHYRRFIILDELIQRLHKIGFAIESITESNGLAVFGDEDPVVIRAFAVKK